ncbi:lysozyme-like [Branchiostoma lanceolatum]|uniref:lysozyme-like n=1 Tax=Branchiostoma lanceolatum TaxID=7740 RepID=UPI0034552F53
MKTAVLLFFIGAAVAVTYDECVQCICIVETSCAMPDPLCNFDLHGSEACGPYQITYPYWIDGGRQGGDWKSCTASFSCSNSTVDGYMARYATEARLGHPPACEDWARIHNGGPNGHTSGATLGYWGRVHGCLHNYLP